MRSSLCRTITMISFCLCSSSLLLASERESQFNDPTRPLRTEPITTQSTSDNADNDKPARALCNWTVRDDRRFLDCSPGTRKLTQHSVKLSVDTTNSHLSRYIQSSRDHMVRRKVKSPDTAETESRTEPDQKQVKGKQSSKGYLVAAYGDTQATAEKLRALSDVDFLILDDRRVSLGVFNNVDNALSRQKTMLAAGISSRLIDLTPGAVNQSNTYVLVDIEKTGVAGDPQNESVNKPEDNLEDNPESKSILPLPELVQADVSNVQHSAASVPDDAGVQTEVFPEEETPVVLIAAKPLPEPMPETTVEPLLVEPLSVESLTVEFTDNQTADGAPELEITDSHSADGAPKNVDTTGNPPADSRLADTINATRQVADLLPDTAETEPFAQPADSDMSVTSVNISGQTFEQLVNSKMDDSSTPIDGVLSVNSKSTGQVSPGEKTDLTEQSEGEGVLAANETLTEQTEEAQSDIGRVFGIVLDLLFGTKNQLNQPPGETTTLVKEDSQKVQETGQEQVIASSPASVSPSTKPSQESHPVLLTLPEASQPEPINVELNTTIAAVSASANTLQVASKIALKVASKAASKVASVSNVSGSTEARSIKAPQKKTKHRGYMVASTGSTGEVISKLRELQDKDFYIFRSKTHVNRLSLGVFSQLDNALRRQAKLEELGVSSEVIDRSFRKQASPVIVTSVIRPTSVETELVETESVGAESVGAESVTTKRVRTKRVRTKSVTVTESNLKPAGVPASSEPELADRRTFLVAATGETNTTVLKLLKLKFNDYQVLRSAPFNNRLSLGVFSQAGNARRRQAMLLSMGIETELFERPRPRLEQVTLSATTGVQDD